MVGSEWAEMIVVGAAVKSALKCQCRQTAIMNHRDFREFGPPSVPSQGRPLIGSPTSHLMLVWPALALAQQPFSHSGCDGFALAPNGKLLEDCLLAAFDSLRPRPHTASSLGCCETTADQRQDLQFPNCKVVAIILFYNTQQEIRFSPHDIGGRGWPTPLRTDFVETLQGPHSRFSPQQPGSCRGSGCRDGDREAV